MKPLEVWTCQRAENLKKKSSKIPINNYAATMVSAARGQIMGGGGGGAPINKSRRRRRPQIVGGGGAARPAHGSITAVVADGIVWNSTSNFSGLGLRETGLCGYIAVMKCIPGRCFSIVCLLELGQCVICPKKVGGSSMYINACKNYS